MTSFTEKVVAGIRQVPKGNVVTYGQIAAMAGNHRASRQVARILHSMSGKYGLPWQRVVGKNGNISLPRGGGYELQKELLESEGIVFGLKNRIDMEEYGWRPLQDENDRLPE